MNSVDSNATLHKTIIARRWSLRAFVRGIQQLLEVVGPLEEVLHRRQEVDSLQRFVALSAALREPVQGN